MSTPSSNPFAPSLLIIEDSRAMRRIIRSTLEDNRLFADYHEASNGEEGLRMAAVLRPNMVLCDLDMPVLDGFGFLRQFRAEEANRGVFVLMLSGSSDTRNKVEGFTLGANDYIAKAADPAELRARVSNYLRLLQLRAQLEQKNEDLERANRDLATLASTDALTGVHNRRYFLSTVQGELTNARTLGVTGSVLMIDIDHFKKVNDTLGHAQGDAVLVAVASAAREALRSADLFARLGGEEFAAWLPRASPADGAMIAERIRAAVASTQIVGLPWGISVSIGVSSLEMLADECLDAMLARADTALYQAKSGGRDRVVSAVRTPRLVIAA